MFRLIQSILQMLRQSVLEMFGIKNFAQKFAGKKRRAFERGNARPLMYLKKIYILFKINLNGILYMPLEYSRSRNCNFTPSDSCALVVVFN